MTQKLSYSGKRMWPEGSKGFKGGGGQVFRCSSDIPLTSPPVLPYLGSGGNPTPTHLVHGLLVFELESHGVDP